MRTHTVTNLESFGEGSLFDAARIARETKDKITIKFTEGLVGEFKHKGVLDFGCAAATIDGDRRLHISKRGLSLVPLCVAYADYLPQIPWRIM